MMKYFAIEYSLNEKIMGKIEQVKEYRHNCHVWDNPNFIDRFPFQKIENIPILSNLHLYSSSKLTDVIMAGGIGFSFGSMVISDELKSVFDNFNSYGVQFFPTYLLHKNKKIDNYWQSHIYDIPYDFIDFNNTDILLKDRDENRNLTKKYLDKMKSKEDFLKFSESMKYPKMIYLTNINFLKEMNYDYFFLRYFENNGSLGIVSERLKEEIENKGCTGIEFRPIELSLQEWLQGGEREKNYGKA